MPSPVQHQWYVHSHLGLKRIPGEFLRRMVLQVATFLNWKGGKVYAALNHKLHPPGVYCLFFDQGTAHGCELVDLNGQTDLLLLPVWSAHQGDTASNGLSDFLSRSFRIFG